MSLGGFMLWIKYVVYWSAPSPIPLISCLQTNTIVTSLTAAAVLYTRSAGVAYFAASAVLCSVTVKIIKRFVRQPRPVVTLRGKRKKTYG